MMKSLIRFTLFVLMAYLSAPFEAEAQYVRLQGSTPGSLDTGHMNISGTGLFGRSISIGTTSSSNNIGLTISKSFSTANAVYGVSANISNSSSGTGYGGYFSMAGSGAGTHYGVYGFGSGSSAFNTYGVFGQGANSSSGPAYGGYFTVSSPGTGQHIGVYGLANGSSTSTIYGSIGVAINDVSTGTAYGGSFSAGTTGSGISYGVSGNAGSSIGSFSGNSYGGYFTSAAANTGISYGVYGKSTGSSNSIGNYGGYFLASPYLSAGVSTQYGIYANGSSNAGASAAGVYGTASNSSSGSAYGGYFNVSASGTGAHYGVYAVEAAGGTGAAVYASGDFVASGTKNAVVKTAGGHRLLYALESAEVWFDDYGQGRLVNGQAQVALDPFFLETVTVSAAHPLKVFIQLTSGEPVPVVVEKGEAGFTVRAPNQLNATFDYRVVAKRKGYENDRLRITEAGKEDPNLYPERWAEIEKRATQERQQQEADRERRESDQRKLERVSPPEPAAPQPEAVPEVIDFDALAVVANDVIAPETNVLIQNHPNPFNPTTKIQFNVKQPGRVTLKVYNSLGQEVASLVDQNLSAGRHTATFDASGLPSGAYFYKLSVNGATQVKRMELVK